MPSSGAAEVAQMLPDVGVLRVRVRIIMMVLAIGYKRLNHYENVYLVSGQKVNVIFEVKCEQRQ